MGPYNVALKLAILQARKKQLDVSEKAGIDNTKLSMIITGRRPASREEKAAIARVLRKPIDELFPSVPDEATA